MYNVFSNNIIILFTVLPQNEDKIYKTEVTNYNKLASIIGTLKVKKQKNQDIDWEKIEYDKIKDKIREVWNIDSDMMSEWRWNITPEKRHLSIN